MKCPRCQQENPTGQKFCGECDTPLQLLEGSAQPAPSQQPTTSAVLSAIPSSATDVQPVLGAIARTAARLCEAGDALIYAVDRDRHRLIAKYGRVPQPQRLGDSHPIRRDTPLGLAVLDRRPVHVRDVRAALRGRFSGLQVLGFHVSRVRTLVAMPLLREGVALGGIVIRRTRMRPFTAKQIALLKTFADQAAIAIENVRLFNETKEALEQQTATAGIIRVISSSPTDVQPVFEAIVRSASRLCSGEYAMATRFDGELLHLAAQHNARSGAEDTVAKLFPRRPGRDSGFGRAILSRAVVQIDDAQEDPDYDPDIARAAGVHSVLTVPMLRDGEPIGAVGVSRATSGAFPESQIALMKTFADQAVIAIQNVRLFTELQEKNQALTQAHAQVTEALEQQTATSEILRVISSSPTDTRPVFEGIARSGVRVCGALGCAVFVIDDDVIRVAATHGVKKERLERFRTQFPAPVSAEPEFTKVIREGLFHLADIANNPEATAEQIEYARLAGYRTRLMVPMLRGADVLGVIAVTREDASPFSNQQVELLKTFADQAVIAIENVRLFNELQARTQELTRSVGQLTALGEVGRAVSSTLDLKTVLSTIVSRAIQLSGTDGGSVYEYDETIEEFSLRASRDLPEAYVEQVRDARPRKGEGAVGRVALTREPVQIVDISDPAAYESRVRNMLLQIGLRALLAVPLIAEDRLVGALIVMRKRTGTFAAEEVALLQTFATQSALAIQNARLFREIADKSHQLEVASQHKSEFLANMSHELRTPLNAVIGFSEVLSEGMFGQLNEKQEEYARDIYSSGQHLLSLINDILDLSKIEAGRMELELTDFHLPAALDNALTLVRERAGRRGIALDTRIGARLGEIRADERKVRQVVLNLLSNAIKFTPEGGRIEVRAAPVDGAVEVSVTDTGVGIAQADQEAIFEEFKQVGTAAKKVEGTGLGLALSRKFIELHGGRIWVKSTEGVGSTFTFTIPVRRGE